MIRIKFWFLQIRIAIIINLLLEILIHLCNIINIFPQYSIKFLMWKHKIYKRFLAYFLQIQNLILINESIEYECKNFYINFIENIYFTSKYFVYSVLALLI